LLAFKETTMAETVHEIDPSADTVIVLKNPGAPFAVWSEDLKRRVSAASDDGWGGFFAQPSKKKVSIKEKKKRILKGKKQARLAALEQEEPPPASDPTEGPSTDFDSLGRQQSDVPFASSSHQFDFDEPATQSLPVVEEDNSIRYRVSSRHLALASGFFRTSLAKNGWIEGQADAGSGMYQLSAADWDPEAFLILLRVLHLRNRLVPRSLPLELLAKVAVLVDYYRCTEAVEIFSEMWVADAKETSPVPSTYGRDLVLWMCVAWVFKLPAEFQQATDVAFKQSKTPTIEDMCLPIPKLVLGKSFRAGESYSSR
jgi:hypothetical protein